MTRSQRPRRICQISGDQSVVKKISELRQHQLQRLFEIYTEEEMNLQILMKEEKEREAIVAQRQARIQRWKLILESMGKDEQAAQAKVEQENKLGDLYSQLYQSHKIVYKYIIELEFILSSLQNIHS